jgi:hypothetical protein
MTTHLIHKICSECGLSLPLEEFAPRWKTTIRDSSPANRQSKCRRCMRAVTLAWRQRRTAAALSTPTMLFGLPILSIQTLLGIAPSQAAKPPRQS